MNKAEFKRINREFDKINEILMTKSLTERQLKDMNRRHDTLESLITRSEWEYDEYGEIVRKEEETV